jgi:hypothetical protein
MKTLAKKLAFLALAAALATGLALPAQAVILDFTLGLTNPPNAVISFAGYQAGPPEVFPPLVGANIDVSFVQDLENPAPPIAITGGRLGFTTGPLTGWSGTEWDFGGGPDSTITIIGGIPALGIADGTTLLTGKFGTATVFKITGRFDITGAVFQDSKNEELCRYFGIDPGTPWGGEMNLSFIPSGNVTPPGAFCSQIVGSGDLLNTPVPVPASVILLGSGLLGLVGFGLRRKQG